MNAHARNFTAALAVREQVPLLIGLMGPSGGGKTFSALRLARGIQSVAGGEIFMIDTEARRGLHYADAFKKADGSPGYHHVPFEAPHGSLDYLAALQYCAAKGAGVIIVDSMSHEHEGVGGLLDFQEQELTRMAGDNYGKREAMKMLAWAKPKSARRQLINALLQMQCNFIFCFRAKNSVKPVKVQQDNGSYKTEVIAQGFMPIAGEEFVFEMTLNALLLPGAEGVPTWRPEHVGEKLMSKLPEQFRSLAENPRPFDERMGADLATWARGGGAPERTAQTGPSPADMPLPERVAAFGKRVSGAPDLVKLSAIEAAAAKLRDAVTESAPDLLPTMDGFLAARRRELTATRPSLSDRIAAFKADVDAAPTTVAAQSLRAANQQLWRDVDAADPDEVGTSFELEAYVNARCTDIEAAAETEADV